MAHHRHNRGSYYDPHYYDRGYGFNVSESRGTYYDYCDYPHSRGQFSGYGPRGIHASR